MKCILAHRHFTPQSDIAHGGQCNHNAAVQTLCKYHSHEHTSSPLAQLDRAPALVGTSRPREERVQVPARRVNLAYYNS